MSGHANQARVAIGAPVRPPQVWVNPSAEIPTDCPEGEDQPGPRILRAIIRNEGAQQFVCLNPSCRSREPMGRFWCSNCWATVEYKVYQYSPAAMPMNLALSAQILSDQVKGLQGEDSHGRATAAEALSVAYGVAPAMKRDDGTWEPYPL